MISILLFLYVFYRLNVFYCLNHKFSICALVNKIFFYFSALLKDCTYFFFKQMYNKKLTTCSYFKTSNTKYSCKSLSLLFVGFRRFYYDLKYNIHFIIIIIYVLKTNHTFSSFFSYYILV